MKKPHWTVAETELAFELVGRRASEEECRAAVGRGRMACIARVDRVRSEAKRATAGRTDTRPQRVPEHVFERARIRASAPPRDLTGLVMGDPPKGYSALERIP